MPLPLSRLLEILEQLSPLRHAAEWDNVGLLIDPVGRSALSVEKVLTTIDLTEPVLAEAIDRRAELIVAYHPPIFRPFKRLRQSASSERVVLQAVRAGLPVWSPHTALDAAPLGVNDWLAAAVGRGTVQPLEQTFSADPEGQLKLVVYVPRKEASPMRDALQRHAGAGGASFGVEGRSSVVAADGQRDSSDQVRLELVLPRARLQAAAATIYEHHPHDHPLWEVFPLAEKPVARTGMGRRIELAKPAAIGDVVRRVKRHLGLEQLRLATSAEHAKGEPLSRVAVCAGAGGSLFAGDHQAELYLTGEMRHHDVREKVAAGASVILCDHTNTERGYLPHYGKRITEACEGRVSVVQAKSDHDPLSIV